MRVVPLALRRDPLDVLASLAAEPGAFLVEVPDAAHPMTLLGCAPRTQLCIRADGAGERSDGGTVAADPLAAIEQFVAEEASDTAGAPFPLGAMVIGYLGYELGRFVEPPRVEVPPPPGPDLPLAVLSRYDALLAHDRTRGQYALVCGDTGSPSVPWLERLAGGDRTHAGNGRGVDEPLATAALAPLVPRRHYLDAVGRILDYLAAGDVYQVNLTLPFTAPLSAPAWALYARLARLHPAAHGAYLDIGGAELVSNSPELFLRRRRDRIETRPIKGTRARGQGPAQDLRLVTELVNDPKERAEHVMIVDLERNDLGRVARPGTVTVESLARVESHATLHHLVSTVSGRLPPAVGLADLLRATFPGGSITGAPKVRAMEIIRELEPWPRGPYTGAVGVFRGDGDLELGLAIRTATIRSGTVAYHAGGGIVADSDPERELAEAWLKTAALRLALGERVGPEFGRCSSG
jgi:para-aminobenzoate synthetase component 1